ncbi:hypothetical protein ANN_27862 [Periplaneta americana]|uniref:Uncharacterized protein n=1 Tax=Periplaneta americana TaxID=6978 RepID=A0ABQ8RVC3_PERAM|nr:hypothetical protein ANN_27862 [Periplaneta americana]
MNFHNGLLRPSVWLGSVEIAGGWEAFKKQPEERTGGDSSDNEEDHVSESEHDTSTEISADSSESDDETSGIDCNVILGKDKTTEWKDTPRQQRNVRTRAANIVTHLPGVKVVMDVIKLECGIDPLAKERSNKANIEDEKSFDVRFQLTTSVPRERAYRAGFISMRNGARRRGKGPTRRESGARVAAYAEGKIIDLRMTGIKAECMDHGYDVKTEMTFDETPMSVEFPVMKNEDEMSAVYELEWESLSVNPVVGGQTVSSVCPQLLACAASSAEALACRPRVQPVTHGAPPVSSDPTRTEKAYTSGKVPIKSSKMSDFEELCDLDTVKDELKLEVTAEENEILTNRKHHGDTEVIDKNIIEGEDKKTMGE